MLTSATHRIRTDDVCSLKSPCTTGRGRTLLRHWLEPVRDRARRLATTDAYRCSQRERRRIESLFGELKGKRLDKYGLIVGQFPQRLPLKHFYPEAVCRNWRQ